jgi:hypothetical protein
MVKYNLVERKPALHPTTNERPAIGVIEAISAGFDAILRRPWLLLIPVALDVFLWVGPRLQAPVLYQQFEPAIRQMMSEVNTSEARLATQELGAVMQSFFTRFNLFAWLSVWLVGVPVVNAGADATLTLVTGALPTLIQVDNFGTYLLLLAGLSTIGLSITGLYWAMLAGAVRGERFQPVTWLKNSLRIWKRLLLLALTVVGTLLMLFLPLSLIMLMVSMISPGLASLVPALAFTALLWVLLYCVFTVHGLAFYQMPLGWSIRTSALIVRANFMPTLGLVVTAAAIYMGLGLIWDNIASGSWLRVIALIGNAAIGTGLIMASLLYYKNRSTILFERFHWPRPDINYEQGTIND